MSDINLVIIEDDATLREGYAYLFEEVAGIKVLASFPNYEQAERPLKQLNPDVLLLDIELPGLSGLDALPLIKKQLPNVFILMLTVYENELAIFRALGNGASGYLTKNATPEKIIQSVREVTEGGGPMSAHIARMVIQSFKRNDASPLTRRETEILENIAVGKSRKMIADDLYIDLETVKSHIKNIYHKLDVHSKADAIKLARDNKFI